MTTKIDKRELNEPDKLQLIFLAGREFVEKNRIRIYSGAGIIVLILVLVGGWYLYQLNYESNAENLYTKAFESTMKSGSSASDLSIIKVYRDLISQYPRSSAAVMAHYRLGNLYRERIETDSAINAYQEFLNKAPKESDLVTLAYGGLGSCYEAKKDFSKALQSYEMAIKSITAVHFEAFNYSNIARVYELMGNPVKATEYYRKALDKTTDPLRTLYLKRKIAFLS